MLYPYVHKADVISAENALCAAMEKTNGLELPLRLPYEHIGKMLRASFAPSNN